MIKSDAKGGITLNENDHFNMVSETCLSCKHKYLSAVHACAAFDRIPSSIWNGKGKHKTPHDGDNGIVFENGVPSQALSDRLKKLYFDTE